MARTVGDFLIERLQAWGVRFLYGYPGDGINGIMGALNRSGNNPRFIQVRHEEMAAFMACGHAKFTGEVGVCLATSGPGAIHLLNGLYDAKLDRQPVVAIVGQQSRTAMGASYQQEVDLLTLFKDVAHEYVQMVTVPEQMPMVLDRAMRIAMSERTVTCIIFPNDLQEEKAPEEAPHEFKMAPGGLGFARSRILPLEEDLRRAAAVLNEGERVAILIGQGARGAREEVVDAAEILGAGVAKALLGKDVLPDDLPFVTGSIGLLGTRPSYEMMTECDTLLMIGSSFPYSQSLPKPGQARGVQIDVDGRMIGIRYPMEVLLRGDSREALRALLPLLKPKKDRAWRNRIESNVREWGEVIEARAMTDADPVNPERLFRELSSRLPDRAIVTCDAGSAATWYARGLKIRDGMRCSLSGTLATMGSAVPYGIAAKFAHPDRPVICLPGDGAFQMNGMNELLTIAKYWREWKDPRLIVMVLHNNDLNMVTWEMRAFEGDPKFSASQDLPDFDYARYAELAGLKGLTVRTPGQAGPAWEEALSSDRPVLIDAITDPNVAPLPPHVPFEHAKGVVSSVLKGDPDSVDLIRQTVKRKVREIFPPRVPSRRKSPGARRGAKRKP
jgi:pyruvate dehydrogenase (quinone)